ncbi:MAG: hypothetical protein K0S06_2080 [Microvirga sp.]|jgi:hypothetical protein|nr:hypothetical protein [Microvirga sp.]
MAKKDKGKSGKAKRKKIAGMKVPKNLALSGDSLAGLITSPVVRELAADVLIAVAGALATNRSPQRAAQNLAANASDAGNAVADAGRAAGGFAETATGAVAEVVGDAARRILPSSVAGEEPQARRGDFDHLAENGGKRKRKERAAQRREH